MHYFVSYYDCYQPEAYIPETGRCIEKDAAINDAAKKLEFERAAEIRNRIKGLASLRLNI